MPPYAPRSPTITGARRSSRYRSQDAAYLRILLPLEDARARRAYGVPSGVNNILIINNVITADRVTALIVSERLGF